MTQSTWAKTRPRHLPLIQSVEGEALPTTLHLTENRKTGVSVDFAIHLTCQPTRVCMGSGKNSAGCYALSGFQSYPNAVKVQARNQRLADHLETAPYKEVLRVAKDVWNRIPRGRTWLRWNGAGDLSIGACRLINALTAKHPDLVIWVISRKPEMVRRLKDRPSLRILLSLDHSTPATTATRLRVLTESFREGRCRLSYTRVSEEDVPPPGIHVVFNKHQGGHYAAWDHEAVCPASLPETDHVGACDRCQRCFAP